MEILVIAAIIPVIFLCDYIYKKDIHKEPKEVLTSLFVKGMISCIPILIVEIIAGIFFDIEAAEGSILSTYIAVFFGVGIIEEGFKWIVAHKYGYKSREFDEVYDIIVYSVFASLGFACVENIMYVLGNGLGTAIARALLAIPGHTCFGILMGYYMAKAKVNEMNNQKSLMRKNLILSILIPALFHTMYDALLMVNVDVYMMIFFVFDVIMVIYCFNIVKRMSHIQQNITTNIEKGNIQETSTGITYNTQAMLQTTNNTQVFNYCPICGHKVEGWKFCPNCGFKMKGN